MDDKVKKQIEDILEAGDRDDLLALYMDARRIGDFRQAHDRLLVLTILLVERSTKQMADMHRQQEATARGIKAVEKRIASLLRPA